MLALPEPSGAQSYLRLGDAVAGPNVAADASDFFVSSQSQTQVGDKACTTVDDNFVAFTHGVSRNAFGNEAEHETKATTDKAIVGWGNLFPLAFPRSLSRFPCFVPLLLPPIRFFSFVPCNAAGQPVLLLPSFGPRLVSRAVARAYPIMYALGILLQCDLGRPGRAHSSCGPILAH